MFYEIRTAPEIKVRRITDGLTFVRGQRHYMRAPSALILKDAALVKTELDELPAGAELLDPLPEVKPEKAPEPPPRVEPVSAELAPAGPAPATSSTVDAEGREVTTPAEIVPPRRGPGRPRKHPRPE